MIYVFTGKGKGKTTCSIGMGIRAVGAQKKVLMIQFLKTGASSENKIIKEIENFEVKSFGREGFFLPLGKLQKRPQLKKLGIKPLSSKDFQLASQGLRAAMRAAKSGEYELLILDEVNVAVHFELIKTKNLLDFLKQYQKDLDMVLTGRNCPTSVFEVADLVTDFKEVKHPYRKGRGARKGIDY